MQDLVCQRFHVITCYTGVQGVGKKPIKIPLYGNWKWCKCLIHGNTKSHFHPPPFVISGGFQTLPALFLSQQGSFRTNLRPHVKQVPHGHIGVALAVAVALREEFVLSPGHVNPLRNSFRLVIYGSVGRRVAVVDELRLEGKQRKRGEESWMKGIWLERGMKEGVTRRRMRRSQSGSLKGTENITRWEVIM